MYESYFGFNEKPFSIAPDPRFVYLSPAHEEALAHLLYGLREGGGFVMLTGEVGTGKTTLLRTLLEKLPENVDVAMIFNPSLTPTELVETLCDELKLPKTRTKQTLKTLIDRLNKHLLDTYSKGRRTVMIIDEAQALAVDVLEQVRLLTNLETTREKLLEIILVGQPELRETLARNDLRQLSQRITARYHLTPLSRDEVGSYVRHRLAVAGFKGELFSAPALRQLAQVTGGIPRLVNEIGDRCLLGAYAEEQTRVSRSMVKRAAEQVMGASQSRPAVLRWLAAPLLVLSLVVAGGWWWSVGKPLRVADVVAAAGFTSQSAQPQTPVVVKIEAPRAGAPSMRAKELVASVQETIPPSNEPVQASGPADANRAVSEAGAIPVTPTPTELFAAWVADRDGSLTEENALLALSSVWGLEEKAVSLCGSDGDTRLRCSEHEGGWQELSALNFPAILRLEVAEETAQVALIGLTRTDAVLRLDGQDWTFPRQALDSFWNGNYLVPWVTPFADAENQRNGDPQAVWAGRQLGETFGQELNATAEDDPKLQDAVRLFQRLSGLESTGRLDDSTLLKLYADSVPESAPRLWREG